MNEMTPELRTAIAALIGAAQNADVNLNVILDDSRTPVWIWRLARADAQALADAVRSVEAALSTEAKRNARALTETVEAVEKALKAAEVTQ